MRELKPIFKCESFINTRRETWTQGNKPVTVFRIDADILEAWTNQNGGITADVLEGCLIDSVLISTRRGWAIALEHYVTSWTSDYYMIFQPGAAPDVIELWEDMLYRREQAEKAYQSITA